MSEPKFTKGPWTSSLMDYHSEDPTVLVISGSDNNVCEILDGSVEDTDLALILAAPDMYEALEEVSSVVCATCSKYERYCESGNRLLAEMPCNTCESNVFKALRKARGEAE